MKSPAKRRHISTPVPAADSITALLSRDPVDVVALRRIALQPGGFLNNDLRRRVWPKILGVDVFDLPKCERCQSVLPCKCLVSTYKDQIWLDTERSLWKMSMGERQTIRAHQREQLFRIINCVLARNPALCYYQGYNDVCSVLQYVCGSRSAVAIAEKLSATLLAAPHEKTFATVQGVMELIFTLIRIADPELSAFLTASGVPMHFALAHVITWFSHHYDTPPLHTAARLFDVFLVSHPLTPVYVTAAMVLQPGVRSALLGGGIACEMSAVHGLLSRMAEPSPEELEVVPRALALTHKLTIPILPLRHPPTHPHPHLTQVIIARALALQHDHPPALHLATLHLPPGHPYLTYPGYPWRQITRQPPDHIQQAAAAHRVAVTNRIAAQMSPLQQAVTPLSSASSPGIATTPSISSNGTNSLRRRAPRTLTLDPGHMY
ncbi:putative TBC1 domain family member 20 [Paratrimastix pyriformis]|uniref:TBC1 domain family member 20 n=1 Tax=Paratrimastix pyriformis TaxID=342808 RepID=A0ABQ8UF34_9EUKA|nr:putative TBC1 domain family member 20 [Paratrimastix pyriformis]